MKNLFVLCVVVSLTGVLAELHYTSENDDFDVETLSKDQEELVGFANCFMGKGTCNPVAADFKKDLPEAIREACAKCTPAQKHILKRFLQILKENGPPGLYEEMKRELDPENKYFGPLEAAIA